MKFKSGQWLNVGDDDGYVPNVRLNNENVSVFSSGGTLWIRLPRDKTGQYNLYVDGLLKQSVTIE